MTLPIALQLYTVREALKADLEGSLKAVKTMGFDHVELAGLAGKTAAEFKALLDRIGLTPIAAHEGWAVDPSIDDAVATARTLGYRYVIQPWWPDDKRSEAGYRGVVEAVKAARAKAPDLTFGYHNHDFEFKKTESGKTGYDVMYQGTDLVAELDTAWVHHAGLKPTDVMSMLKGRVPLLHIKDLSGNPRGQGRFFTEVGTGVVDVAAIVRHAPACGAQYLVVEQDNDWIDNDSLKSARISLTNLKKIVASV